MRRRDSVRAPGKYPTVEGVYRLCRHDAAPDTEAILEAPVTDSRVITAFHFVCEFCHAANDYRYSHGPKVHPYLVTRRCDKCHRVNQLGFLLGTLVDGEDDPEVAPVEQLDLPLRFRS